MKTLQYNPRTKFSTNHIEFGGRIENQTFKVRLSVGDKVLISDEEYQILETDEGFTASIKQGSVIVTSETTTKKSSADTEGLAPETHPDLPENKTSRKRSS